LYKYESSLAAMATSLARAVIGCQNNHMRRIYAQGKL